MNRELLKRKQIKEMRMKQARKELWEMFQPYFWALLVLVFVGAGIYTGYLWSIANPDTWQEVIRHM